MGTLVSAQLAVIFCMYREHITYKTWKTLPYKSLAMRFRDDVRFILASYLKPPQISSFHKVIQEIYGPDLLIKLENSSHFSCNFIGITIFFIQSRFIFLSKNKNFPFDEKCLYVTPSLTKVRFPDVCSEWPSSIFTAIVYSTFLQALRFSSEPISFLLSFTTLAIEFLSKHYRPSWLISAIMKLNISYHEICTYIISLIIHRFKFPPAFNLHHSFSS